MEIREHFRNEFGTDPSFMVVCPGRVNLIGEHIDYSGYGVLPMALEQSVIAVATVTSDNRLQLKNRNSQYCEYDAPSDQMDIDSQNLQWFQYFLCGYRGMAEALLAKNVESTRGMQVLIEGSIPPSSGLSSSSALVCCAALITLRANADGDFDFMSRVDVAEMCASCERYIGTQGGGMDQAICLLAEDGKAKRIDFKPLRCSTVNLPAGCAFVIANCCKTMNKAATSEFNQRVVECKLAALVLAKQLNVEDWQDCRILGDAQRKSHKSLAEMCEIVESRIHPKPYTRDEVKALLEVQNDQEFVGKYLTPNTAQMTSFKLQQRARHCYSEALRVDRFAELCGKVSKPGNSGDNSDLLVELGDLMNASHDSARDDYEASCDELDQLVDVCRKAGAMGSRFTGAGWGGCTVSLVEQSKVDVFMNEVRVAYFDALPKERCPDVDKALFATKPAKGATIIKL